MSTEWRELVRDLLLACDQPGLNLLLLSLGVQRVEGVEEALCEALDTAPHDVQIWWSGQCNCDGHLN